MILKNTVKFSPSNFVHFILNTQFYSMVSGTSSKCLLGDISQYIAFASSTIVQWWCRDVFFKGSVRKLRDNAIPKYDGIVNPLSRLFDGVITPRWLLVFLFRHRCFYSVIGVSIPPCAYFSYDPTVLFDLIHLDISYMLFIFMIWLCGAICEIISV